MNEDLRTLIDYRLAQAAETLEAARELSSAGHLRDAVNRAYYAMFYCGLALLCWLQRRSEPASTAGSSACSTGISSRRASSLSSTAVISRMRSN